MGRPTELIVGPTELDLGPQKNRRFKESIWSILVGQNWKNDISWCKKSNNFFGSKFPKVYIFSHKKTGWVLTFLVVVVFLVGSLEKHGDSPLDFRTPMIDQVILGTVSLGPPDPRIASDAFLSLSASWRWRCGVSGLLNDVWQDLFQDDVFEGEHEPRKAVNDGVFFYTPWKLGFFFKRWETEAFSSKQPDS